ncbi:unnamed protein product, partial [Didymodactylos carnosus]
SNREEFIQLWQQCYSDNKKQMSVLEEFRCSYTEENVRWWYTRDCCLYKTLNKTICSNDIEMIITCQFLLIDLYKKLEKLKTEQQQLSTPDVYCGVLIDEYYLHKIEKSINEYISMNWLLFGSDNRQLIIDFIETSLISRNNLKRVLFHIHIDNSSCIKPFAYINGEQYFMNNNNNNNEQEILFMIDSIFQINSIRKTDNYSIIDLRLCNEMTNNINFAQSNKSLKYYEESLIDTNHMTYGPLGHLHRHMNYFKKVVNQHGKLILLKIFQLNNLNNKNEENVASIYKKIGLFFDEKNDNYHTLKYYCLFMKRNEKLNGNTPEVIPIYNELVRLYVNQMKYDEALLYYEKILNIQQKFPLLNYHHISKTYENIANMYKNGKQFDLAFTYFQKAIEVYRQSA